MTTETQNQQADLSFSEGVAADDLRAFVERRERLEEGKAGIGVDIKELSQELRGRGYDIKAFNAIIRLRKKDHSERQEEEAILELYMQALGLI